MSLESMHPNLVTEVTHPLGRFVSVLAGGFFLWIVALGKVEERIFVRKGAFQLSVILISIILSTGCGLHTPGMHRRVR